MTDNIDIDLEYTPIIDPLPSTPRWKCGERFDRDPPNLCACCIQWMTLFRRMWRKRDAAASRLQRATALLQGVVERAGYNVCGGYHALCNDCLQRDNGEVRFPHQDWCAVRKAEEFVREVEL